MDSKKENKRYCSKVSAICNLIYDWKNNKQIRVFVTASGIGIYGAINGEPICSKIPGRKWFSRFNLQMREIAADDAASRYSNCKIRID
jgi:hypothetical protein